MFKKLARKILANEIENLKEKIKDNQDSADAWESRCFNMEKELTKKCNEISMLQTDYDALKRRNIELEEQNAVLRQYYHLDEDPSQETIDKMYLDEKYREQEKELVQLRSYKDYHDRALGYNVLANLVANSVICTPYAPIWQSRLY